ncbi:MAG: serine hydrolase [Saprospiraceae bacterium]
MKYYILIITILTTSLIFNACQQPIDDMNYSEGDMGDVAITDSFHLAHMGEILFHNKYISAADYAYNKYIDEIDIYLDGRGGMDLYMRAFQANSLTNYLKALAPEESIDQLLKNGNYQFSFIVDDRLIYTEDVHYGAGIPRSKNANVTLCKPLHATEKIDSWGWFMWNRFMLRNGGEEALTIGSHVLKIELRSYLKIKEKKVSEIIAEGSITLNIIKNAIEINPENIAIQNIDPHDDFKVSKQEVIHSKIKELNIKVANESFLDVTSIVAIKDGNILIEEYFNGSDRSSMHDTRSLGKTVTGMLVGLAIDKGYIIDENQTLSTFYNFYSYENKSKTKSNITIKDLLTMTSLLDGSDMDPNSSGNEDKIQESEDWMDHVLNLGLKSSDQDKKWDYFTGGTMLLGDIVDKSVPNGIEQMAMDYLFEPLNIKSPKWFYTPQSLAYGGGGLQMTTLDLAKLGMLYQNNGKWNNEQIISQKWVEKSLSKHISLPQDMNGTYGYLWYNKNIISENQLYHISYAAGNGGNMLFIFHDIPLIVVITATAYNTMKGSVQGFKMLSKYILPSINLEKK